jgi:hypothetical protein
MKEQLEGWRTHSLRNGREVVRTELARTSRLPLRPFQLLDESNKLLQLSETLDRCELQIFANQRGVNIALNWFVSADFLTT